MNAKTIYWIIAISTVCIGAGVTYNYYSQEPELTTKEHCEYGSIDACIKLVKENKELVKKAELENIEANKKIESNLSGTDFKFSSEKLSQSN